MAAIVLLWCAVPAAADDPGLVEARALVADYENRLEAALAGLAIEAEPAAALERYAAAVDALQREIEAESGWAVRRVARQPVDPTNLPDHIEGRVLEAFEERADAGEAVAEIEYLRVADKVGGRFLNYIRALPPRASCAPCHGSTAAPSVRAAIRQRYPEAALRESLGSHFLGAASAYKLLE